jgi:hypothetical protein
MTIDGIRVSLENYQHVVLLKEQAGERYLPIWIGPAEADAIARKLRGAAAPRPLSHDLLWSVISVLGASVESVIIDGLKDDTFYGEIILNTSQGRTAIDSRPSDALALAVRAGAPIFAEDTVLDEAGLLVDTETGEATPQDPPQGQNVGEDELRGMSAFTDFLDTLDMDDLGEGRQENE